MKNIILKLSKVLIVVWRSESKRNMSCCSSGFQGMDVVARGFITPKRPKVRVPGGVYRTNARDYKANCRETNEFDWIFRAYHRTTGDQSLLRCSSY